MTTRSYLMLLAATLAPLPLYAQDAVEAPAAVAQTAVAPIPVEHTDFSPLALIPADADAVAFLPMFRDMCGFGLAYFDLKTPGWIGNAALGFGKGSAKAYGYYNYLSTLINLIQLDDTVQQVTNTWCAIAKEPLRQAITQAAADLDAQNIGEFTAGLAVIKLAPVYGVMSIPTGHEAELRDNIAELHARMKEQAAHEEDIQFVTSGGLAGLKIDLGGFFNDSDEDDEDEEEEYMGTSHRPVYKLIDAELARRSVYILVGTVEDHAVLVICEDLKDIAFARKPEDSILYTPQWKAACEAPKDGLMTAFSVSPDTLIAAKNSYSPYMNLIGGIASVFDKMAAADADGAEDYKAAAAGVRTLIAQVDGMLSYGVETPEFVQVWADEEAYHVEMTGDACGASYQPAKMQLKAKAADPETIFCMEYTPFNYGPQVKFPDWAETGKAFQAIYTGVLTSFQPELKAMVEGQLQEALSFLPEISAACTATGSILEGMGGTTGFVVDGKAKAPAYLFGGESAALPRVAVFSGVTDREKISTGWDALLQVAGDVLEKSGQDRSYIAMLPIIPQTVAEGVMSYSVAIPGILTPDMGANTTISGTAFAAGTSANLNKELVTSATGTEEFAGCTITIHTQPLAATFRSMADAQLKAAGTVETTPIAYCQGENEDELVCFEGEEALQHKDDCEFFYERENPTPEQRTAAELSGYAETFEAFARSVKEINSTITIKDGLQIIRVDAVKAK